MDVFQDVFISYGRADSKAFAIQLHQALLRRGLKVWFDQNDIPLGVDYQNQINDGLSKSHNFLFIISPHSVNSDYCRKEIELAAQLNKRIIPVLHVQQIDYPTWQQRYPNGTEAEWKAYQAQGLHYGDTRNPNMHPAIAKINWLNYQAGECEPDTAFQKLLSLIHSDQDYVYKHTFFLAKALEWERHQKQIRYLLVGEERADAEAWLKVRFEGHPPCEPTDLHCEFICESTENANNLMTQVFISYSNNDKEFMVKLSKTLMRESFTIWTNKTDIQTGESFQAAIQRGIEQTDNVVYLISPSSVKSDYCQTEISYALSLNKRIIPVLIQQVELSQTPSALQALQLIDFTDTSDTDCYRTAIAKLLNVLQDDAKYYEQHKLLLTKALKWERQNRNTSILLRGYNLRQAEAWLKLAQGRSQHPPLPVQQTFILESLDQPEDTTQDVFISYSRVDSDFARKLNDALQLQGKTTWFDQESIASGADFQQEIYRGIETSDNMLFIITPSSVKSPYCADEVEHALKLNKRIVTVLHRPIDTTDLHPGLATLQWIDFNQHNRDFYANFGELVRTLDSDREHVRSHTKWSQRSLEWQQNNRSADLLLRGSEFVVAANWLQNAEHYHKHPPATDLQKAFIAASKTAIEAGVKREKLRLWVLRSLLATVSIALVVAIGQWRRAQTVQEGQIIALAKYSNALFQANQEFEALIEAIRAGKQLQTQFNQAKPSTKTQVLETLLQAFYGVRESNRLVGHDDYVSSVAFSSDGETIATASGDGTVKLWNQAGQLLNTLPVDQSLVTSVKFSPDGQQIATGGSDATIKLWSRSGELLQTIKEHSEQVNDISFSPDGDTIASVSANTIKLWSRSGELLHTLNGHQDLVLSVSFSPDGTMLASGSADQTVKLWTRSGQELKTLNGHRGIVNSVAFSPDGQTVASASDDKTVKLWTVSGQLIQTLEGHQDEVQGVSFSPDERTIATVSWDQSIILWNRQGQRLQTIRGHRGWVNHISFSPDGRLLATASNDNTVKLWLQPQQVSHVLSKHQGPVTALSFSPDGQLLATAASDGANLWSTSGQLLHSLGGHTGWVMNIQFSPDSQTIGTVSGDRTIKLWSRAGQLLRTITESAAVISLSFSPDGKHFVTGSEDGTVSLWNYAGQRLHRFKGHDDWIQDVAFSPDGQRFVTASFDNTAKIWSRTGRLLHVLTGHHDYVNGVRFSPDGDTIATASGDGTVKLWSASGQLLQTLTGDEIALNAIAFSPDGQLIAVGSGDNSTSGSNVIRLWTRQGQLLQVLQRHDRYVSSVSFSHDGQVLASGGNDHQVVLWDLTIDRLENQMVQRLSLDDVLSEGCRWVNDYLKNSADVEESDRILCNSQ
jgi:WD40 repeat protein